MSANEKRVADLSGAVRRRLESTGQTPAQQGGDRIKPAAAWITDLTAGLDAAAEAAKDPAVAAGLSPQDRATISRWRMRQALNGGDDAA